MCLTTTARLDRRPPPRLTLSLAHFSLCCTTPNDRSLRRASIDDHPSVSGTSVDRNSDLPRFFPSQNMLLERNFETLNSVKKMSIL
ncbi:hypothetical protein BT93_K1254 [Corymbia citriodora subsp. variegata]|nr:hypothetical protein BT93_K1254 [Corymbia citriodora subsp. variegata]